MGRDLVSRLPALLRRARPRSSCVVSHRVGQKKDEAIVLSPETCVPLKREIARRAQVCGARTLQTV